MNSFLFEYVYSIQLPFFIQHPYPTIHNDFDKINKYVC